MIQQTHSVERTSPLGGNFLGTCILCGKTDLTSAQALESCPNPRKLLEEEVLLNTLSKEGTESHK